MSLARLWGPEGPSSAHRGGVGRGEHQNWGGGGVGKGLNWQNHSSVVINSGTEGAKYFSALKMVENFFTKYIANDDFSEPPQHADSKNPVFIFRRILGLGHLRGLEVSLGRIGGGGASIEPLLVGGGLARGLHRPPPKVVSPPSPDAALPLLAEKL